MGTSLPVNTPSRYKLQIALYSSPAVPLRRFLHLTDPANSIDILTSQIQERFHKIYPFAPPLAIVRVQDADNCDLDPGYIMQDVFPNGSQVKVFVNGNFEEAINRSPQFVATAAGPKAFNALDYQGTPSGGLATPVESEGRKRQRSLSLGVSPGPINPLPQQHPNMESNVPKEQDKNAKIAPANGIHISPQYPTENRLLNSVSNGPDLQGQQSLISQVPSAGLKTPYTKSNTSYDDLPLSKKRKLNKTKETLMVPETSPPRSESRLSITTTQLMDQTELPPVVLENCQPSIHQVLQDRVALDQADVPVTSQTRSLSETLPMEVDVSASKQKTFKKKKERLDTRESETEQNRLAKATAITESLRPESSRIAAERAAKELSAASDAALDAFRAFDMSSGFSQRDKSLDTPGLSKESPNLHGISDKKKSDKELNIRNGDGAQIDHSQNTVNCIQLPNDEASPTPYENLGNLYPSSSQTGQIPVSNKKAAKEPNTKMTNKKIQNQNGASVLVKTKTSDKKVKNSELKTNKIENPAPGPPRKRGRPRLKDRLPLAKGLPSVSVEPVNQTLVLANSGFELKTQSQESKASTSEMVVSTANQANPANTGKVKRKYTRKAVTTKNFDKGKGNDIGYGGQFKESTLPETAKLDNQTESSSKGLAVPLKAQSSHSFKRNDDQVPLTKDAIPSQPSFKNCEPPVSIIPLEHDHRQSSPSSSSSSEQNDSILVIEQDEKETSEMQRILKSPPKTNSSDSEDETVSPAPSSRNSSVSEDNSGSESLDDGDRESTASEEKEVEGDGTVNSRQVQNSKHTPEPNDVESSSPIIDMPQSSQSRSQFYKPLSEISRGFTPAVRDSRTISQQPVINEGQNESSEDSSSSSSSEDEVSTPKKKKRNPLFSLFKRS